MNRWMLMVFMGLALSVASVEGLIGSTFAITGHTASAIAHWVVAAFFGWLFWDAQKTFHGRHK